MGLFDSLKRDRREQVSAEVKPPASTEEEPAKGLSDREIEELKRASAEDAALDIPVTEREGASESETPVVESDGTDEPVAVEESESQELVDEPVESGEEEPEVDYDDGGGLAQDEYYPEQVHIKTYAEKKPVTHVIGSTKIVAIINQKGGVGKSTTAVNLSAALGELHKQVLLVDLDPQGNSTSGLGVEKGFLDQCVYDVLLHEMPIEDAIIPDVSEELDLLPATINLAGAEVELVQAMARENRLRETVGSMRGKYDYIFIDCPPSLGLLTINALVAADKLIIPIQTEFYALEGVTKLLESMKRVKNMLNPTLDIFGVLLTMYDGRTTLSRQVAAEVRNFFGDQVFETIIPRTVKLSEAPSYGIPITQYDPTGKGAIAYSELAKEVVQRG